MCWSAQVSYEFACLDTLFVVLLLAKSMGVRRWTSSSSSSLSTTTGGRSSHNKDSSKYSVVENSRQSFAGTYAGIMAGVAIQEWAQYGLWVRGHLQSTKIQGQEEAEAPQDYLDVFFSILALLGAESVPLTAILSSALTADDSSASRQHRGCGDHASPTKSRRRLLRRVSQILWVIQAAVVLSTILYTHQYTVVIGPNHHQVWICESATDQFGGYPLHAVFYWMYLASGVLAVQSHERIDASEKYGIIAIGLISGMVLFLLYGNTLEACSIWCWSAFLLGVYLCLQEDVFVVPAVAFHEP